MNFYLEALQDEHILLANAMKNYREPVIRAAEKVRAMFSCGKAKKMIFAGMGSSLYAAKSICPILNQAAFFSVTVNCFEVLTQMPEMVDENAVLVLISQSGNTPEILQMMEYAKKRAAMTVAVLNEEDCRMKGLADEELYLGVGEETPVSNKSYYAQVAILNLFAAALAGEDMRKVEKEIYLAIDWYECYRTSWKERTMPLIDFIKGTELLELLGDGAQGGAAQQAGLVLREMTGLNASYYSSSDFSHGWFDIAKAGYTAVFLCDHITSLDKKMIFYCLDKGSKVLLLGAEEALCVHENLMQFPLPKGKKGLLPLYSIVPLYFIAGILAKERERG